MRGKGHEAPMVKRLSRSAGRGSKPPPPTSPCVSTEAAADRPTAPAVPHWLCLRPDSPFRPPNWRSLLAAEIAGRADVRMRGRLVAWADERVLDLVRLGDQPPPSHPLVAARTLLRPEQNRCRLELEARLLAGQSDAGIAAATGVGAAVVAWFHDVGYCCRDRLRHTSHIVHLFLGCSTERDDGRLPPELLKQYAYFGGVEVLELVLRLFDEHDFRTPSERGKTAAELWAAASRQTARAAILARLMPAAAGHRESARLLATVGTLSDVVRGGPALMGPLVPPDGLAPAGGVPSNAGVKLGKVAMQGQVRDGARVHVSATQPRGTSDAPPQAERAARDRCLREARP